MLPVKIEPHISKVELEQLCRKEKSAHQLKRYQAILWGYETNYYPKTKKIAEKLCVDTSTVYGWYRAWNKEGLGGIIIKEQPGRLPILTEEEEMGYFEDIISNPRDLGYEFSTWTLKSMNWHMGEQYGKSMSLSGISKMLKRKDITLIVPRPMPAKADKKKSLNLKTN